MADSRKIVLPGGSGFLGHTLADWLTSSGWEAVVLSRDPVGVDFARGVAWDGRTLGAWAGELDGADAVVNLAGRSVNCRYTKANRRRIMDSRVESTRVLGQAVAACDAPPPVWLNSSTATIYEHTYGPPHGEDGRIGATPEAKDAFSIDVARAWEEAFEAAEVPATRKATLRTAMVFGPLSGGVYRALRMLAKLGLGGRMSHGRQWVSWIHADDFCRAIAWLIDRPAASGVYNLAAPEPLTNAEMMRLIRRAVGMPIGLPAARWMLEVGMFIFRSESELIIKSRRVIPARLSAEGFEFTFPDMAAALADIEGDGKMAGDE